MESYTLMKKNLLRWSKKRAKENDIPFNLTIDDFEIPTHCPIFGKPLKPSKGRAGDFSPTLDRVVPEVGYVRGNVVVISLKANRLKSDAKWRDLNNMTEFYKKFIQKKWMLKP